MNEQALVTIQKLLVRKSDTYGVLSTGLGGEPGASAEWDLTFTVAGQSYRNRYDNVRDGSVVVVNKSFLVDLGPLQNLRVEVTGTEIDDFSANDLLPAVEHIITPATNWKEGQTFTSAAGSHEHFEYSVVFDIRKAA